MHQLTCIGCNGVLEGMWLWWTMWLALKATLKSGNSEMFKIELGNIAAAGKEWGLGGAGVIR